MGKNKRFAATQQKKRKSREDGDVAKSRDITGVLTVFSGVIALSLVFFAQTDLIDFIRNCFSIENLSPGADFSINNVLIYTNNAGSVLVYTCLIVLGVCFVVAFISEAMQVGLVLSFKALSFKFDRLNFFKGLRRLVGIEEENSGVPWAATKLYEVGKMCVVMFGGVGLTILVGILFVRNYSFFQFADLTTFLTTGVFAIVGLIVVLVVFFLSLGTIDLLVARTRRAKRLRMDDEEFKREMRESEGDAETKTMRKQLHQELLIQGIIQGVRKAKVLVVDNK